MDDFDDLLINLKKKYEPKTNLEKLQQENNEQFYKCFENYSLLQHAQILATFLKNKDLSIEEIVDVFTRNNKKLKEYMYDCMKDM